MSDTPQSHPLVGVEALNPALVEELRPLWQQCWDECSAIKGETCAFHGERGFSIDPDVDQYQRLSEEGSLVVVTLRDEGVLRGYALMILYRALHHKPAACGNVDNFYVEPAYRSYVRSLISKIEAEFESRGVIIIGWPTSPEGHLFSLLKSLGYAPDDVVMEKRLCALQPQ